VPRRPKWLSPNARRHWRELVPVLQQMGVLAAPYSITLGLLTEALADYIAYSGLAAKTSLIIKTPAGGYMHNPIYKARDDAWERVLKAAREFGLSPSAVRGVLKVAGANPRPTGLAAFR
jgi:P27 family predicted phage terminase small subunit